MINKKIPLLVLGLDSLPPDLTQKMARNGTMPFLHELITKGSFGPLKSVIPANTGAAWNSAWTGLKPDKHGYFGFYHYDFKDDTIHISTSDRLKAPTFWEILNSYGLKTLVINSPMQFPATSLNGIMVSGFMTPSLDSPCVYPEDFRREIAREIPDYVFDVRWNKDKDDLAAFEQNIQAVVSAFEQRVRVSKLAAARSDWDVLTVVFKSVDNMLHYTWEYLDEPHKYPERHKLTLRALKVLDDCCRELALMAGYPDVNILICSDHGHGPVKGHLFVNRLLAEWSLLRPQNRIRRSWSKFLNSCRKRLGAERKKKKPSAHIGHRFNIQWHKSRAVMIGSGVIYLNVKGRQPEGLVEPSQYQSLRESIAERLRSLQDPATSSPMILTVECPPQAGPEPVPEGQVVVPDILFEPADGVVLRSTTTKGPYWHKGYPDNLRGCHRMDGIVLAAGPAFARNQLVEGKLYDIAPTILAACGISMPNGLDGKIIEKILNDRPQVITSENKMPLTKDTVVFERTYNKDEENIIINRLSDLGYLE